MKKIITCGIRPFGLMILFSILVSCSAEKRDQEIKADLVSKAKDDINFAGVVFMVSNAKVYLWGLCPTEHSRALVREKIASIHVIKAVSDQIGIGAVKLDHSLDLKLQADSVAAKYPGVAVSVANDVVTLAGVIPSDKFNVLMTSVGQLNPKSIRNQLHQVSDQ
ncbi:hypothetical protein ASF92_07300 [Pedobacter sp. Leaf176]|nr:hypothetical protein ASF92_07300 [Pedobacter sp. Leaf176]